MKRSALSFLFATLLCASASEAQAQTPPARLEARSTLPFALRLDRADASAAAYCVTTPQCVFAVPPGNWQLSWLGPESGALRFTARPGSDLRLVFRAPSRNARTAAEVVLLTLGGLLTTGFLSPLFCGNDWSCNLGAMSLGVAIAGPIGVALLIPGIVVRTRPEPPPDRIDAIVDRDGQRWNR